MIQIDPRNSTPIFEQIVQNVKELCFKGVLKPGDQITTVHELSKMIVANPNAVSKAYKELEKQGVVECLSGKGTFVTERAKNLIYEEKLEIIIEQLKSMLITALYKGIDINQMQEWINREMVDRMKIEEGE